MLVRNLNWCSCPSLYSGEVAGSEVKQNDAAVQEFKLTFIESGSEPTSADDTAMELRPTEGINTLEGLDGIHDS